VHHQDDAIFESCQHYVVSILNCGNLSKVLKSKTTVISLSAQDLVPGVYSYQ